MKHSLLLGAFLGTLTTGLYSHQDQVPSSAEPDLSSTQLAVEFETGSSNGDGMESSGTRSMYLDLPNNRWADYHVSDAGEWMRMYDGEWAYVVDLAQKVGTKQWIPGLGGHNNPLLVSGDVLEKIGMDKAGTEEVAGLTCTLWSDQFSTSRTWLWNNVPLAVEQTYGTQRHWERAVRVDRVADIPENRFRVPEDVSLTDESPPGLELLKALHRMSLSDASPTIDLAALSKADAKLPTLEPFTAFKLWPLLAGEPDSPLDLNNTVRTVGTLLVSLNKVDEILSDEEPPLQDTGPDASLRPKLAVEERIWWMLVPIILDNLGRLAETKDWTLEHDRSFHQSISFLALNEHGIALDARSNPTETFDAIDRWFIAQTRTPAYYAAMIPTLDYGPFAGLPFRETKPLQPYDTAMLDHTRELRLSQLDAADRFVVQCLQNDEVVWSRLISDAPKRTISQVTFAEPVERLGPYGWRIPLQVVWHAGTEGAHLYLGPDAEFLFYYISW